MGIHNQNLDTVEPESDKPVIRLQLYLLTEACLVFIWPFHFHTSVCDTVGTLVSSLKT